MSGKRLPLEHVRIVDLTQAWAGTYATQLLADMGAQVIKIESRTRLDPWRGTFGTVAQEGEGPPYNRSYLHNSVNRNKLGITLDLATTRGRELFLGLVRDCDVVAENFTPRVLKNFGLGYERLEAERPGVILLSMPAFGLTGPYSEFPGIGGTVEPMGGNSWLLGEPGGEPQASGVMYADAVAGLNGAAAVLTALYQRSVSGRGCHLEVSQQESMIAMLGEFYAGADLAGLSRLGNADLELAPHEIYRCRDDDSWVAIAVRDDDQWRRLREVCRDVTALQDGRFDTAAARYAARADLDALLEGWTVRRSAAEVESILNDVGIPAARVRSVSELSECPQLAARDFFVTVEQPEVGRQRTAGIAARLSRTPGSVRLPAPRHGEHSREVLRDLLGLDDAALDELEAAGITGEGPPPGFDPGTAVSVV